MLRTLNAVRHRTAAATPVTATAAPVADDRLAEVVDLAAWRSDRATRNARAIRVARAARADLTTRATRSADTARTAQAASPSGQLRITAELLAALASLEPQSRLRRL